MGANGNTVFDGSRLNLIQGETDIEFQQRMLRVGNQQAPPFEQPDDAAAERSQQLGQFIGLESAGAVKGSLGAPECVGPIEEQHVQVRVAVEC